MKFDGNNYVDSVTYIKSANHRFYLKMTINPNPKSQVIVIMKNPSETCDNVADGVHILTADCAKAKCRVDKSTSRVLKKLRIIRVLKKPTTYKKLNMSKALKQSKKLINFIKLTTLKKYDEIIILNLYSYYDPDPSGVNDYYYGKVKHSLILNVNKKILEYILNSYKGDVICAWGESNGIRNEKKQPDYRIQVDHVDSILKNNININPLQYDSDKKVFRSRNFKRKYPPHGLSWK